MRVLAVGNMYPPHALGGYELVWSSAMAHLRSAGHVARVLTSDYRRPDVDSEQEPDVYRELRWYWRDHGFPRMGARATLELERHNAAVLDRHLADLRPDVVAWWAMGGMSLSLIERVRRTGIAGVGFVHDDWMDYGPKVDRWQRLCRMTGPAAKRIARAAGVPTHLDLASSARWEFVSEHSLRRAERSVGKLPDAGVLHSGIERELFAHGPAPEREWDWRLAYVGRIDPRKGIGVAIEALARLPEEAMLDVVGTGDPQTMQDLHELVGELGLGDRVSFRSVQRTEIPAVYAEADCLLFPVTWEEPWGLVPLEAMAMGRPVIATGTGGSAEYLRDGQNTVLVAPGDPDAISAAAHRLAGNAELRSRLRAAGLEDAARFTDEAFNRGVETALLGRVRARPPQ